eukprot:357091-Chlamydomonas_euryale.AAC.5
MAPHPSWGVPSRATWHDASPLPRRPILLLGCMCGPPLQERGRGRPSVEGPIRGDQHLLSGLST